MTRGSRSLSPDNDFRLHNNSSAPADNYRKYFPTTSSTVFVFIQIVFVPNATIKYFILCSIGHQLIIIIVRNQTKIFNTNIFILNIFIFPLLWKPIYFYSKYKLKCETQMLVKNFPFSLKFS